MYHHVKKLMYTVKVGVPDVRFGSMLLEQFGGATGELTAALQYWVQSFHVEQPGIRDLLQTIAIALMGTLIGMALGVVLAVPATSTLAFVQSDSPGRHRVIDRVLRWLFFWSARLVLNILRSIPELVWVLICILAVGIGPFAGTIALGLHTAGVLGKLYAETMEEVPFRPVEALRSLGARPLQVLLWAIWPQARPLLSSYTVLRWEMNLRASTILGLVGGGGLGQAIYNNVQLGFYTRLSTLILLIYAMVLTSDWIGERLRLSVA